MATVDDERRTVETVEIARSGGSGTLRRGSVSANVRLRHRLLMIISTNVLTRRRRIFDRGSTVTLAVDRMVDGRAVTRVIVAPFGKILYNKQHVIYTYLPERSDIVYTLRSRQHNKNPIPKTSDLNDRHFLMRLLYKDCY